MPSSQSRGSKTDPYYLAAPVGWQTAMEIKRRFADAEPPIPVVGAASVDAAMGRLEDNPRCVAVLLHFAEQPPAAIELMCRIKERWKRPVVAFHPGWHRDDVRRALQLGADCLLGWPFEPSEVLGDLEALHKNGVSVTRAAILKQGGPSLLAPDPALWADNHDDDDWRARLGSLAERLRAPAQEEPARVTRFELSAPLTKAAGGQMTPALAGATMTVLRIGNEHLERIAVDYGVETSQLEKTVEVGLQADDDTRAQMLSWLEDLSQEGAEAAETGVMVQLRRAAQVTLKADGAVAGEVDVLAKALSAATGVPVAALTELRPSMRVQLSNQLVGTKDAEDALQAVRMMVLVSTIADLSDRTPGPQHLAALTALLGLRAGVDGVRPGDLVRALARLDPPAALRGLELERLAPVRAAIPEPGNALDKLLRRAIDELVKAGRPLGYVDQNRLVALLRSARQGGAELVGPSTWRTVTEVVSRRRTSDEPRAVKIIARLDRVLAVGGEDARARLVRALEELLEQNRKPMDAPRFIALCRNAATGLSRDGGRPSVAPGSSVSAMLAESPTAATSTAIRGAASPAASMSGASAAPAPSSGFDPSAMLHAPAPAGPQVPAYAAGPPTGGAMAAHPATASGPMVTQPTPPSVALQAPATRSGPQITQPRLPDGALAPQPGTRSGPMAQQPHTRSGPMVQQPHTRSGAMAQQPAGPQVPGWTASPAPAASRETRGGPAASLGGGSMSRAPVDGPPVRLGQRERTSPAVQQALALADRGDIDQSVSAAMALPDEEPGVATALNRAALGLYVAGRRDEADALWTRAAALAPDRPNVLLNLARLRHEQGRGGEARLLVRQVLALRPHLTPAKALRAQIEGR